MFDDVQVIGRATTGVEATNKVLRNTYTLLGLTMIPTVIGAMMGMSAMKAGYFNIAMQHPFMFAIGAMASSRALRCFSVNQKQRQLSRSSITTSQHQVTIFF